MAKTPKKDSEAEKSEAKHARHEPKNEKKKAGFLVYLLYILLLISIMVYIFTGSSIAGAAAFILIIGVIVYEFSDSFRTIGFTKTIAEVCLAILLAVALIWFIPSLILHTSSPIDVVASCSMLPTLHRGDIVILHDIPNMSTFLEANHIPVINVSRNAFQNMEDNMQSEFLEPVPYSKNNASHIYSSYNASDNQSIGFYNIACMARLPPTRYSECLVTNQSSNLIQYNYSLAREVNNKGANITIPYVSSITIDGTTIVENYSNPIIVYKTTKYDYFTGDIIHRLVAALDVNGSYYTLTKGDNNPVLDIEALNYPSNTSNVVGYVVSDVRYIGYLSLIIRGEISPVAGCNQTIVR